MAFYFDSATGRPIYSWQIIGNNGKQFATSDGRLATKDSLIPKPLYFLEYTTAPNTTSFTFHTDGAAHYTVDWGDGEVETLNVPGDFDKEHIYSVEGQYVIKVHVNSGEVRPIHFVAVGGSPDETNLVRVEGTGGQFGTSLQSAWRKTLSLTTFSQKKMMDVSKVTEFTYTWRDCENLKEFPRLNFSKGKTFLRTWQACKSLTSFPSVDFSSATDFRKAWHRCENLTDFPPNQFDTTGTLQHDAFTEAFTDCALTAQSIENILVSLDTNGQTNCVLGLQGGTNATEDTWSQAAKDAHDSLLAKDWIIIP